MKKIKSTFVSYDAIFQETKQFFVTKNDIQTI